MFNKIVPSNKPNFNLLTPVYLSMLMIVDLISPEADVRSIGQLKNKEHAEKSC